MLLLLFSLLAVSLDALSQSARASSVASQIDRLKNEVQRSTASVNSLLQDLLDAGRKTLDGLEPTNVLQILADSITEVSQFLGELDIGVTWDIKDRGWINGHSHKLQRVMTNIISNALEASDNSTKLSIGVSSIENNHSRFVKIDVRNTGSFIAEDDREKIFELFHTKGKKNGTGLGLAIARRIVDAHGGEIKCTSEAQTPSTTFHITFPALDHEGGIPSNLPRKIQNVQPRFLKKIPDDEEKAFTTLRLSAERRGRKIVISMIDDDLFYREFCEQLLIESPYIGPYVELKMFESHDDLCHTENCSPDIIICDLNLGRDDAGTDDLDLLHKHFPNSSILFHSDDDWQGRQLTAKGYSFFPKPITVATFFQAISSIN